MCAKTTIGVDEERPFKTTVSDTGLVVEVG